MPILAIEQSLLSGETEEQISRFVSELVLSLPGPAFAEASDGQARGPAVSLKSTLSLQLTSNAKDEQLSLKPEHMNSRTPEHNIPPPRASTGTRFIKLGLIDYQKAWDYQTELFNSILAVKGANRTRPADEQEPTSNYVIFCEHPHVFTLGKSGNPKNLLIPLEELDSIHASFYPINRGGDITYHGPGQIVGYPVVDMENFFTDIHKYMRLMEEAVIRTLAEFNIVGGRIPGLTGVWLDADNPTTARKICALGVKTSRWVTMHGFAFNVNTDLRYFDYIVPCGILEKSVTSLQMELGHPVDMLTVEEILKEKLGELFGMVWI